MDRDDQLICDIERTGLASALQTPEYLAMVEEAVRRKLVRMDGQRKVWTIKGNIARSQMLANYGRIAAGARQCEWEGHPLHAVGFPAMVEVTLAGQRFVCQAVSMLGARVTGVVSQSEMFAQRGVLCRMVHGSTEETFAVELRNIRVLGRNEI